MEEINYVKELTFESDSTRGTALAQLAAWVLLNSGRVDVVTYIGDASKVSLFYTDTQE